MKRLALAFLAAAPLMAANLPVYDDQLQSGFADWSWATRNLAQTSVVHAGSKAISFEPSGWAGLFLHRDAGFAVAQYQAVEFWIRGSGGGGQLVTFAVLLAGSPLGSAPISGISGTQWTKVTFTFAQLGVTSGVPDGIWFQAGTGDTQSAVYVDDIQIIEGATTVGTGGAVTVTVDPTADRHPVSPLIYGVSLGSAAQLARLKFPVRRWGGNGTTRYNWQADTNNSASDWFFINYAQDNANPGALPSGSTADVFIDEARAAGSEPLITVPLIGWTPMDRIRRWGYSVQKYGAQQQTECTVTGGASWCNPDAGNGKHADGSPVTGNDPHDTSKEIGTSFVTDWMKHIASRTGTAGQGGVKFFALDNEPALWSYTHQDVHPQKTTYDELWQRTRDYAGAIKAQDPNAQILGPVSWGWCEYFFSGADGCADGPDRQAHGDLPWIAWYLKQVNDYKQLNGIRLVDYLDIHGYPYGNNIGISDDESAATSALRLRSIKCLYDPTYSDESWVAQPVNLIPRMKGWINQYAPGTKLAITEYNWGNDKGTSSTLAQAEVLAVFGREGVDLANRWIAPADNTMMEDAFKLYLNYDGNGAKVSGDSVKALTSDVDAVGAYAIRGSGNAIYLLLFNKDTLQRPVTANVTGGLSGSAHLYRFDGGTRLSAAGDATPSGGALSLTLPPRSATLVVATLGTGGGGGTPCVAGLGTLCLNASRFSVKVSWRAYDGSTGTGKAVPLTTDTGYFWFFASTNVELVLKVLDGRPVNGKYWVLYGALSDVAYTITVTDSTTGLEKTYQNELGHIGSVGDTSAF